MKKILSITLAAVMLLSLVPTAFAAENNWQGGTKVEYTATANEQYTVTVPATLAPGAAGDVVASGTWGSNRKLTVTADKDVTLTNSINAADQKVLDVTFAGIELTGSNTESVSDTKQVAVANITDAIFGTWSGTFNYNVAMSDVAGGTETPTPEQPSDPDTGDEGEATVAKFSIDGEEYEYEEGMTYGEWVNSEYNTYGFLIAHIKHSNGNEMDSIVNADKTKCLFRQSPVKLDAVISEYHDVKSKDFTESDMWWELVEPEANLITFTIKGTEYQAEKGMTWAEWVASDYNTLGVIIDDDTAKVGTASVTINESPYTAAKSNDIIESGRNYTYYG